jgi:hypothetical protein
MLTPNKEKLVLKILKNILKTVYTRIETIFEIGVIAKQSEQSEGDALLRGACGSRPKRR